MDFKTEWINNLGGSVPFGCTYPWTINLDYCWRQSSHWNIQFDSFPQPKLLKAYFTLIIVVLLPPSLSPLKCEIKIDFLKITYSRRCFINVHSHRSQFYPGPSIVKGRQTEGALLLEWHVVSRGGLEVKTILIIALWCYLPFYLCWHLHRWCKSSGNKMLASLLESR